MTAITGTRGTSVWFVNGNGSIGLLTLKSTDGVSIGGNITFDDTGGREDVIEGGWDDASATITFRRFLPGGGEQIFTGFLGDNAPDRPILAGSFSQNGVVGPRSEFAWAAYLAVPLTTP